MALETRDAGAGVVPATPTCPGPLGCGDWGQVATNCQVDGHLVISVAFEIGRWNHPKLRAQATTLDVTRRRSGKNEGMGWEALAGGEGSGAGTGWARSRAWVLFTRGFCGSRSRDKV